MKLRKKKKIYYVGLPGGQGWQGARTGRGPGLAGGQDRQRARAGRGPGPAGGPDLGFGFREMVGFPAPIG